MSEREDNDEDKKKDKKKANGDIREKTTPEPMPANPNFFEWLESHFDGQKRFPERVDVRVVTGRNCERMGPRIKMWEYPASAERPSRERLVAITNEIMFRTQQDCDVQGKKVVYGVHVWNLTTDDHPLERWIIRCAPKGTYKSGDPDGVRDPEDEEELSQEKRFSSQIMNHQERMVDMLGAGFEKMLDRDDRSLERAYARIQHLEMLLERKGDQLERALDLEVEREERRQALKLKNDAVRYAMETGFQLLPPILSALTKQGNGASHAIAETADAITLRNFFASLSQEQMTKVVGAYRDEPPHECIAEGVLSFEQAKLLFDVSKCVVPAEELDKLMPGAGALSIAQEQITTLQQMVMQGDLRMDQLVPVKVLLDGRLFRWNARQKNPAPQG